MSVGVSFGRPARVWGSSFDQKYEEMTAEQMFEMFFGKDAHRFRRRQPAEPRHSPRPSFSWADFARKVGSVLRDVGIRVWGVVCAIFRLIASFFTRRAPKPQLRSSPQELEALRFFDLPQHATDAEIKERFRKLALKYHPDKHAGASAEVRDRMREKFMALGNHFEVLIPK